MKGDKMFEDFSEFMGENENKIVDDFCDKIKKDKIGNLTLDEYLRFRFWKSHTSKEITFFHSKFVEDTKTNMSFDSFCELLWNTLDDVKLEWLEGSWMDSITDIKDMQIGEA